MDLSPKSPVDKEFIQRRTTPEDIFEHYLGVEVRPGYKFRNPLRHDEKPTCKFYYAGGQLFFSDFAVETGMDCFALVQWIYNCGFYEACQKIAADMNLREEESTDASSNWSMSGYSLSKESSTHRTSIRVRTADFTKKDASYLKTHGVSKKQTEKYLVQGIDHVWVNGTHVWMRTPERPAIGYYFGTDDEGVQMWKIYFYEDTEDRFLCNTGRIQGWPQLPDTGELAVITKSLKDVMALDSFGIPAIAPQGETIKPPSSKIEELTDRFDHVYSLYDFEYAGITMAGFLKREYGIPALFLTDGSYGTTDFGAKDFSDYVKDFGRKSAYDLIGLARRHHLPTGIEAESSHGSNTEVSEKLSRRAVHGLDA